VSSFFDDPDAAIARVEAEIRAAQERAERAGQVKERLDRVRGQARSRRGEVTVVADPAGRLLDVDIADDGMRLGARDLGRLIVETAQAASRDAGRQALAITAEAFGEESPVTERLRGELVERLR
jgi:DNA-binding protein YbaB